jgi:hypothetical protein
MKDDHLVNTPSMASKTIKLDLGRISGHERNFQDSMI